MTDAARITNDVLAERIEHFRNDLHDDLGRIEKQLAQLVPREVYESHRVAWDARVTTLEARVTALESRGRWMLTFVLIPVAAILVQIWLSNKGVKP